MKVVLFCGGLGTRIRDFSDAVPKPMIPVGYRPIIWNVMKYYAHFGHKEFILCLGYKADSIKNYFLHYDECLSNDFVYSDGGVEPGDRAGQQQIAQPIVGARVPGQECPGHACQQGRNPD